MMARCSSSKRTVSAMGLGRRLRGGSLSGKRTETRSPRARIREARAGLSFTATAPPATSPKASWRKRSPGGLNRDIWASTYTATSATAKKIQREYGPRCRPNAAPWLYTSRSWNQSPNTDTPGVRSKVPSATSLVIRSRTTVATPAARKTRRSRPAKGASTTLPIFLFLFASDAEPRMGERVEPLKIDLLSTLMTVPELFRGAIEAPERFVHVPEIAPLL